MVAPTAETSGVFLGFDPGGENRFGVAAINDSGLSFETVSFIKDAVDWAVEACHGKEPNAAGIDTILHWATGRGGFRNADKWLRANHPLSARSVMPPNGLYGAMVIGGVGLAMELRKKWPQLILNETHPKVLFHALTGLLYPRTNLSTALTWFEQHTQFDLHSIKPKEDEFDAILSAWATREALAKNWRDLTALDDLHIYPVTDVRYFWPVKDERGAKNLTSPC